MILCCSQKIAVILILISIFGVNSEAVKDTVDPSSPYLQACSMANLFVATNNEKDRYAYGLTVDCTFFFFNMSEYDIFEKALDFYQSQYDLGRYYGVEKYLCPVDMFNVRYISQNFTPYFEIFELQTGTPHLIPVTKQSIFFKHITPKSKAISRGTWRFGEHGWATHYGNLLIHARPHINHRTGRSEVRTYIRHKNEKYPGACIKQSFSKWHLFQIYPLIGDEAYDFKNYLLNGIDIPHRPEESNEAVYYFWSILVVICLGLITIAIGCGLSIWKTIKYFLLEKQRYEIEKFVVACYVEKLEKLSKGQKENEKPKKKKKKKKRNSPSESQSSYHHRRRHHRRGRSESESLSKIPHGSKLIPLPNEKDLFASDRKKVELKPAAVQEPRKDVRRDPSKGSNASVCSLRSITQSVEDSQDWTGKGVRVSQRKTAIKQYKEDQIKDEDEAYKLGMNLSTFKRKKKRQQHGLHFDDDEKSKKAAAEKTQYPLSIASGMSSYTKPTPPKTTTPAAPPKTATATPAPPGITNSTMLRGDTTAQDEARFQRAEKELQERFEAEQRKRAKNVGAGASGGTAGDAKVQLGNNNPYGSLSVPLGSADDFPQKKK